MNLRSMICPYCGGLVPGDTTVCPDCQEDLAGLARLELAPAIYYNEALAAARQGRLSDALARLQAAIALDGGFVPAHRLLAKVYARHGMWAEAEAAAARAVALAPDDAATIATHDAIQRADRSAHVAGGDRVVHIFDGGAASPTGAACPTANNGVFMLGMGVAAAAAAMLSGLGKRRRGR